MDMPVVQPAASSLTLSDPATFRSAICLHEVTSSALGVNCYSELGSLLGKKILIRVDLNIDPKTTNFREHPRTQQVLKTIEYFLQQGARIVVISHLSQTDKVCRANKSIKAEIVRRFKNEFVQIGNLIQFIGFSRRESALSKPDENEYLLRVKKKLGRLKNGHGLFLENVRLLPSEQNDNPALINSTLEIFDFFIHDGFGVCHRSGQFSAEKLFRHASKERKALGPSSCQEWSNLLQFSANCPDQSIALILAGDSGKFTSKLSLLEQILETNKIGLVYFAGIFGLALLKSNGSNFGATPFKLDDSTCEKLRLLALKYQTTVKFLAPTEYVGVSSKNSFDSWKISGTGLTSRIILPADATALDQRPADFKSILNEANISRVAAFGPFGYYAKEEFAVGTQNSYLSLASWTKQNDERRLLIGGGNSMEALSHLAPFLNQDKQIIKSSGGGAGLSALGAAINLNNGKKVALAGIRALQ